MLSTITNGFIGLCESRKGTGFLLTLVSSSVALFTGHLQSSAFAMVIATIFSVFSVSHAFQTTNTPGGTP